MHRRAQHAARPSGPTTLSFWDDRVLILLVIWGFACLPTSQSWMATTPQATPPTFNLSPHQTPTQLQLGRRRTDDGDRKQKETDLAVGPGIFVNLVDHLIGLFTRRSDSLSLIPPPGYIIIWLALAYAAPLPQLGLTLLLYGGSILLVQQLEDLDRDDDDDILGPTSQRRKPINGEVLPPPQQQQQSKDFSSGFSMPMTSSLVDVFCFVASLALGAILTVPFGAQNEPPLFVLATSSSSTPEVANPMASAIASLALLVAVTTAVGIRVLAPAGSSGSGAQSTSSGSSMDSKETDPNAMLMDLWDDQLRARSDQEPPPSGSKEDTDPNKKDDDDDDKALT